MGSSTTVSVQPKASRNEVVSCARGIGIILVVLGHNSAISKCFPALIHVIFYFHVPLFFFLSGMVFSGGPAREYFRKGLSRLVAPFALTSLCVALLKIQSRGLPVGETVLGVLWGTGATLPLSQLWFLPTLFLTLLSVAGLGDLCRALGSSRQPGGRRAELVSSFVVCIVLLIIYVSLKPKLADSFTVQQTGLPWSIDLLPLTVCFTLFGRALTLVGCDLKSRHLPKVLIPLGASSLLTAFVLDAQVDLNLRVFSPFLPALLGSLGGIALVAGAARALAPTRVSSRLLVEAGRQSMLILILHATIQHLVIRPFMTTVGLDFWGNLVIGAIGFLAGCAVPMILGRIVVDRSFWLQRVLSGR